MLRSPRWRDNPKSDPRRRQALTYSAVFLAVILVLSIIHSSQIGLVLLLYLSIILEAVFVSAFAVYSRHPGVDSGPDFLNRAEAPRGTDIVSSMNLYVTYAARGSDHSRREIAFTIRDLLEDLKSSKLEDLSKDEKFQSDLNRVVYPYLGELAKEQRKKKKGSRQESEAYLSSLERIVSRLRGEGFA